MMEYGISVQCNYVTGAYAMKPKRGLPDNKTYLKHDKLQLKIQAFEAYGGCKCACCGVTDPEFLTLDHINLDGGSHRREVSPNGKNWGWGGYQIYRQLRRKGFPPGYQVLCMNCNFGKTRNKGICPHKKPSKPLEVRLAEIEALRGISAQGKLFKDMKEF
jgi:hypothetical protein